jgi:hypothetical protein
MALCITYAKSPTAMRFAKAAPSSSTLTYANFVSSNTDMSHVRKHSTRHGKPHRCTEKDCPRREGFSTRNDLDRHKKSVHNIVQEGVSDRSYKCAGLNCPKREKIWPRLDNFKSHVGRMHKTEDVDDVVKRSKIDLSSSNLVRC